MFQPKIFPILLIFALASCGQIENQHHSDYAALNKSESLPNEVASRVSDSTDINSPERKIIKTADIRCRVTDVYKATEHLENLVTSMGGQISESRMENEQNETKRQSYATDSIKEIRVYTTVAHLSLKIPVVALDSVLKDIPNIASFMDSRHLKLDDVTYQYLTNQLKNDAAKNLSEQALKKSKKSAEVIGVSQYDDERTATQIDRKINNLQMLDQVRYATLTLDLYQPSRIDAQVIADTDQLSKPGFGYGAGQSLLAGWQFLQTIFLLLLKVWPLVLVAVVLAMVIKRRKFHLLRLQKAK